ncbi:hypothetical protein PPMP20_18880 [Paraburkholderia phymatum]|uniref:Uncharacterized protein n=1 Tax=Paraburkholderia phymatum (strain DSM 17167 / CIP 108236 / LMG 21445 / STM815) TaxID=391038 RepID=B2JU77_PARP8|nr:hypothetical protein [Paraburkholderia phymatum]ACC76130.1 hypothetical protein Bphy_7129 [Paraburkholderia phymatum STM815]
MSDDGFTHGKCAAFGCPLPGSLGVGGEWVCFCHHGAASGRWQNVTRCIRSHEALASSISDARRFLGTPQWQSAYREIRRRLTAAGLADLLPGKADESPCSPGHPVAVHWLMRMEMHLLDLCNRETGAALAHPSPPPGVRTAQQTAQHASAYLPDMAKKPDNGDAA